MPAVQIPSQPLDVLGTMKQLNFHPQYESLLRDRKKTTTIRVGPPPDLEPGEEVMLMVGWDENAAEPVHRARILEVYSRRITDLHRQDSRGESPDCKNVAATRLVLSCIYRRVISNDEIVHVVKFEHV